MKKWGWLVIIVFALMLIAALYITPIYNEKWKVPTTAGEINKINSALELYFAHSDSQYPRTLPQLRSDNVSSWNGPYLTTITTDPWGNDYIYISDGSTYTIQSIHESDFNINETIRYCKGTGFMEFIPQ